MPKCLNLIIRLYSCLELGGRWSQRIRTHGIADYWSHPCPVGTKKHGPRGGGKEKASVSATVWFASIPFEIFPELGSTLQVLPSLCSDQCISLDLFGRKPLGMCLLLLPLHLLDTVLISSPSVWFSALACSTVHICFLNSMVT